MFWPRISKILSNQPPTTTTQRYVIKTLLLAEYSSIVLSQGIRCVGKILALVSTVMY